MSTRVTQTDIARELRVSPTTVSRALDQRWAERGISSQTRSLVVSTALRLGLRHRDAVELPGNDLALVIGPVWPFHQGVFMELPNALIAAAHARGWDVRIITLPEGGSALNPRRLDGVVGALIAHMLVPEIDLLQRVFGSRPIVAVNTPTDAAVDQLVADDRGGMAMMADYLVAQGHRQAIYHTSGYELDAAVLKDRLAALETSTLAIRLHQGESSELAQELAQVRHRVDAPTVVICHSDLVANDLMTCLYELRIRVPDDLSVVAGNDSLILSRLSPPITAVHVPVVAMVQEAVALLAQRIAGDRQPARTVRLNEHLVLRASVAARHAGA